MTTNRPHRPLTVLLCVGTFLLVPGLVSGAEPLDLLAPANGATVASPAFHLVFTTPTPLSVQVELDGATLVLPSRIEQKKDRYVHHLRVPIGVGEHELRLLDAGNGFLLGSASLARADWLSKSASKGALPRNGFHTREGEATCAGCHLLPDPEEALLDTPTAASVLCGSCHREVRSGAKVHGPVAVGSCYTCHDPGYTPSRFATGPTLETCGSCHAEVVAAVLGGTKYAHGPVAAGACTACHSPHSGEVKALLRDTPSRLCLDCHGDTLARPFESSLHGKLSCIECHTPHGGSTLALTSTGGNQFCTGCHQTVDPVKSGHPILGHPVETVEGVGAEGRPVRCTSCHPPHGTADVSKLDIASNEKVQRRFCTGCHS